MSKMKKNFVRITKLLLTAVLLILSAGMTVSAGSTTVVELQPNEKGVYVYTGENQEYDTTVYHKISVPSSGAILVSGCSVYRYSGTYGSISVELCNANLKSIDSQYGQWVYAQNEQLACYGVKKGTYYLKTSGYKDYVLSASFVKKTDKGGTSKKKAYTIKQGMNSNRGIQGVMPAGEKSSASDWYKFKVTKKKILTLKLVAANTGNFEFYLYGPSYKNGIRIDSLKNEGNTYYSINSRTKKKMAVKPGTYYIRVRRASGTYYKKASGVYSINWKMK